MAFSETLTASAALPGGGTGAGDPPIGPARVTAWGRALRSVDHAAPPVSAVRDAQ